MTAIASNYHAKRQAKPPMNNTRRAAIEKMKREVTNRLTKDEIEDLEKYTSYREVKKALKQSKNRKYPGYSGITYEFWKSWPEPKEDEPGINIVSLLLSVFNDVEKHGTVDESYGKGIMYLLYKKKDRTKIENYRPITLMETDYKIHTKTIVTKLGDVCQNLLNEDQAGFVPRRTLYDHTQLADIMPEYAEIKMKNGCIVSLDQEKAYDKIDHNYMWQILETYGFPKEFIDRSKRIYNKSTTSILVNGVIPIAIKVLRGMKDSEPMSCLLYDLAIEPLACALRRTNKIKGISIPNYQKLIVKMFADDTLV